MPASQNSVSGQLMTVTEITLVRTPPEESKGHRSAKGMNDLSSPRSGTLDSPAPQTAGISWGKEDTDTGLK